MTRSASSIEVSNYRNSAPPTSRNIGPQSRLQPTSAPVATFTSSITAPETQKLGNLKTEPHKTFPSSSNETLDVETVPSSGNFDAVIAEIAKELKNANPVQPNVTGILENVSLPDHLKPKKISTGSELSELAVFLGSPYVKMFDGHVSFNNHCFTSVTN
jgi:hypothetical protein